MVNNNFKKKMSIFEDYAFSNGRSDEQIVKAEKELNLKFSKEYVEYLKEVGLARVNAYELTGICPDNKNLDVVYKTKLEKSKIEVPNDWYLVLDDGYCGQMIWQDSKGFIYLTKDGYKFTKINDSIFEFLKDVIKS